MTPGNRARQNAIGLCLFTILGAAMGTHAHAPAPASPDTGALSLATVARPAEHTIHIALLRANEPALTPECFSMRFLELARIDGGLDVAPELIPIDTLDRESLLDHPIAVMSGEGAFRLSPAQVEALGHFLERGGFLIASAGCSSHAWAASFERIVDRLRQRPGWQAASLQPIDQRHELMSTIYDIKSLTTRRAAASGATSEGPVGRALTLSLEGRICIVYSPDGLNDTDGAGDGCCCCGGSEIREARWLNANAIAYALIR
ncbi:MAG: DUF4159 domain-containing protein [Phycisphaerales bacterium]